MPSMTSSISLIIIFIASGTMSDTGASLGFICCAASFNSINVISGTSCSIYTLSFLAMSAVGNSISTVFPGKIILNILIVLAIVF